MNKTASAYLDEAGKFVTSAIPYVNVANLPGSIAGHIEDPTGEKELKDLNTNESTKAYSLIPGIGAYRSAKRLSNVHKMYGAESPRAKAVHQVVGPATQALLSTLIGAGIGGVVGNMASKYLPDDEMPDGLSKEVAATSAGALTGAGIGATSSVAASLIGAVAAAISKTRTAEEQREASNAGSLAHYLVPGYGTYDRFKTLGHSNTIGKKASISDTIKSKLREKMHEHIDSPNNTIVHMEGSKFNPHKLGPLYRDRVIKTQHDLVDANDLERTKSIANKFNSYARDIHQELTGGDGINQHTINTRMPSYGLWGAGGAIAGSAIAGEGNRVLGGATGLILGMLANYGRRKLTYGELVKW